MTNENYYLLNIFIKISEDRKNFYLRFFKKLELV